MIVTFNKFYLYHKVTLIQRLTHTSIMLLNMRVSDVNSSYILEKIRIST